MAVQQQASIPRWKMQGWRVASTLAHARTWQRTSDQIRKTLAALGIDVKQNALYGVGSTARYIGEANNLTGDGRVTTFRCFDTTTMRWSPLERRTSSYLGG